MMDILQKLDQETSTLLKSIGHLADEQKIDAYLVGGPVRDLYLGNKFLDIDIVIVGNAMNFAKTFAAVHGGEAIVYAAFKTATVNFSSKQAVDFVTARKETYAKPGAFPKVTPSTIKDDLFRRDFTINAMAVSINRLTWGKLVDPYFGLIDLKRKRIRVLHDKSFIDDPTRLLRATRFKDRFNFTLEAHTQDLFDNAVNKGAFETITAQRYKKEHDKILKEKNAGGDRNGTHR